MIKQQTKFLYDIGRIIKGAEDRRFGKIANVLFSCMRGILIGDPY